MLGFTFGQNDDDESMGTNDKGGSNREEELMDADTEDIHTFVRRLERDQRVVFASVASMDKKLEVSISRYEKIDSRYERMDEGISEIRSYMQGQGGEGDRVNRQLWVAVKDR